MTQQGDFYEEDEPVEKVALAFDRGIPVTSTAPCEACGTNMRAAAGDAKPDGSFRLACRCGQTHITVNRVA